MKTIKELVDILGSIQPCEGFNSMEFEDVTSEKSRKIHLRADNFKQYFAAYETRCFNHEQNMIFVVINGVKVFALEERNA